MTTKTTHGAKRRPSPASVRYPKQRGRPSSERPAPSSRLLFLGAVGAAVVLAGALVAASQLGSRSAASGERPTAIAGTAATQRLLGGIPQDGVVLGAPDAPVTLVEYADIQCPYCGMWARDVFPTVVNEYVRPGKVRLELRPLAFVGADSETGARAALAAASQHKLWNVVDLLYRDQGAENTGWLTESFLRSVAGSVPGLDHARMLADAGSIAVEQELGSVASAATAARVERTPTFDLGPTGGPLHRLEVDALDVRTFRAALDRALVR